MVAALAAVDVGALVLPPFEFSTPQEPNTHPDALHLPWDVLLDLLVSILRDLHRQGFRRYVFVECTGQNGRDPGAAARR